MAVRCWSLPEETTQLLIDLCTYTRPSLLDTEDIVVSPTTPSRQAIRQPTTKPSYLSYLALNRLAALALPTVSSDTAVPPSPSVKTVRLEDTASRLDSIHESSRPSTPPAPPTPLLPSTIKLRVQHTKRLSPRLYFPHVVDHIDHFVVFLETVARRRWGQSADSEIAATTAAASSKAASLAEPAADGQNI
jgi:vacuolar protein sorting-associated protein 11